MIRIETTIDTPDVRPMGVTEPDYVMGMPHTNFDGPRYFLGNERRRQEALGYAARCALKAWQENDERNANVVALLREMADKLESHAALTSKMIKRALDEFSNVG